MLEWTNVKNSVSDVGHSIVLPLQYKHRQRTIDSRERDYALFVFATAAGDVLPPREISSTESLPDLPSQEPRFSNLLTQRRQTFQYREGSRK